MFKLLKNTTCYDPDYKGKRDILLVLDKIAAVEESIEYTMPFEYTKSFEYGDVPGSGNRLRMEVLDCTGIIACPGLIDQHLHILGGGGEGGPGSNIPEIKRDDIILAGVSTVVGLLGLDSIGKTMQGLLSKARSLEAEGLNTRIYTGYYGLPAVTLTSRILTDIACIDKVIGAGEIAISDYRSSHPTLQALKELSFEVLSGGMLGGKAGVLHIHVGDGKKGLEPLMELVDDSDFPVGMYVPTHLNRNRKLFEQAMEYAKRGGNVDFTAGEKSEKGLEVKDALEELIKSGMKMGRVTISSDGNGSMPAGDASRSATSVGNISMLLEDVRACIMEKRLPPEVIFSTVTRNVAQILKLYPSKGVLRAGSDADIVLLDEKELKVAKLFIGGKLSVDNGKVLKQ